MNINKKQTLEEIGSFFNKLRTDFEVAIRDALARAKEAFIKIEPHNQAVLEEYCKIAEVEKLK